MQKCHWTTSRLPFCKPLNKSSGSPQRKTRTGLMRKLRKSRSSDTDEEEVECQQKKAGFHFAYNTLRCKLQDIQNEWWTNPTVRTQLCVDTVDYRRFCEVLRVPPTRSRAPYRVQMGKSCSLTGTLSLTAGLRTSTNLTVQKSVTVCITQQPVKSDIAGDCEGPQNRWRVGKLQEMMAFHQRYGRMLAQHCTLNSTSSSSAAGRKLHPDLCDTGIITLYKNKGEGSMTTPTTLWSPCSPLPAKSLQEYCWTDWYLS